jgi:sucrose-6-phosphate hydrolase SacC (GH32 family)
MFHFTMKFAPLIALCSTLLAKAGATDIVIADFEGDTYGDWKTSGEAFGSGPAHGALPGQMAVSGFDGKGLVNSFLRGDDTTGSLTSPAFKIERRYIRFLIGGGNYPGETCINLLASGRVARTATGPNSEHLEPQQWDVTELAGQNVTIEIVDQRKGGWGHINVDQIVQTDASLPKTLENASREIRAEKKYLNLPIKNGAPKKLMTVRADDKLVDQFTIELADGEPDWWAFLDLAPFKSQTLSISVDKLKEDSKGLTSIEQSDKIKGGENLYEEKLRPQFHFTASRGWNNDPNGLVFYKGEYHLFFQHNPYGWNWGNMHWGHAVSSDLVHWQELDETLYPDELGTMFSGSAVVDENNTAGLQKGSEKTLIAFYTAAGGDSPLSKGKQFSQCMAYSNDRGRTWTKYEKNPVLPHIIGGNRDPKVLWYAPENKWLMALYLDQSDFALFESKNLKSWAQLSKVTIPGTSECPEFFPLGDQWVFYGGNGRYIMGKFDGKRFDDSKGVHNLNYGNCFYASQTYNMSGGDSRRIMIPWGQINIPGMPFNQMMGLPVEWKLKLFGDVERVVITPVKELQSLRGKMWEVSPVLYLKPGFNPLNQLSCDLAELEVQFTPNLAREVRLNIRGTPVIWNAQKRELSCLDKKAPLSPGNGRVTLHIFVDRTSIDIFGNDGLIYMPMGVIHNENNHSLGLEAIAGDTQINGSDAYLNSLKVWPLKSAWKK